MNPSSFLRITLFLVMLSSSGMLPAQKELQTPHVNSILYTSKGTKKPLIVGLGGSEGGNAWASDHWKDTRERFLKKGYAFLALGYFGAKGAPDTLNRISLEDIHDAIIEAAKDPSIDKSKIAIVGGSRGGDLALLLASYYTDISCVVALVPSHAVFPGHTMHFSTSCWTWQNKELPFVPVNEAAVPHLMKGELRKAFEAMLTDTVAEQKALIQVENIHGPVLLVSATNDEIVPTSPMCEKMVTRFQQKQFKYAYEHHAIEGSHAAPLKQFDMVFNFLGKHFPVK